MDNVPREGDERNSKRTLVTTQTTGMLNASATERCSLLIPINPAFAPTTRRTKSGRVAVKPNKVVLRYLRNHKRIQHS